MANIYEFKCVSCLYSAEVSGGLDRGFEWTTKTVLCKNCKELGHLSNPLQDPWGEGEEDKLSSVDDGPSGKPDQQSLALFKQAAELVGAEALFEEWDPDEEEDQDSPDDPDWESLFGYSLDTGKCQEEGHTLIDWPSGGSYECPKCGQQMLRGEIVMNVD